MLGHESELIAKAKRDKLLRQIENCFVLLTLIVMTVPAIAFSQINGSKDEITDRVSQSELPIKQDGTPAHPYSDASQCPTQTDLIFWLNGRSIPSIPPSITVCFVGNQPFENSRPGLVELRDR